MAEKVCDLIKSGGGGMKYPDYSNATSIVDNPSRENMNWVATADGYLWIVTNTVQILASSLLEDGVACGVIMNSVLCPVRKGHTYTTNVPIRQARFMPLV